MSAEFDKELPLLVAAVERLDADGVAKILAACSATNRPESSPELGFDVIVLPDTHCVDIPQSVKDFIADIKRNNNL